jgi:3-isopropylmalate/(R)-2-methylmalate dehydratase small subunit
LELNAIVGTVLKLGDDIDTDAIIPARYLSSTDTLSLTEHVMENFDPTFKMRLRENKIIVAGRNFGCGSSREHAPLVLKAAGVQAIIAENFARIFFRNSINIGLPVLEAPNASLSFNEEDRVRIDIDRLEVRNLTTGICISIREFSEPVLSILEAGGLVRYLEAKGEW